MIPYRISARSFPSFRDLINLVESTTPSPAFERWFAGSKVVDQSGNPLVVYHGTNQPIEQFSTSRLGTATGEGAGAKHGFFFTASEEEAGQYADNAGRRVIADIEKFEAEQQRLQNEVARLERLAQKTGNWEPYEEAMSKWEDFEITASREDPSTGRNVIAAYLAIRNPKVIDFGGERITSAGDFDETITAAKRAGHDGMILRNIADSPEGNLVSDHFVAFEPSQIKRVTATAFDPSSPNINEDADNDEIDVLQDMCETISTWVGHGPVPDADMQIIWDNWHRPEAPIKAWRVQVLTPDQATSLEQGVNITPHRFLSWTRNEASARTLAVSRSRNGAIPAIIEEMIPAERVCIVISDFLTHLYEIEQSTGADFETTRINDYAHEDEIICRHDGPLVLNSHNTQLLTASTETPKIGDRVFAPGAEDGYEITEVVGKEDATWVVVTDYLGEVHVHYVAPGEWEEVEFYG